MSIEAMKQALEALQDNRRSHYYCEDTWYSCPKHEDGCSNEAEADECNCGADKANEQIDLAITALRQAIEQAEKKEPVALYEPQWADPVTPLYTALPKREWVGLTTDEIFKEGWKGRNHSDFARGAEWAEAKLKEKNT